jgi:hypothetical protein
MGEINVMKIDLVKTFLPTTELKIVVKRKNSGVIYLGGTLINNPSKRLMQKWIYPPTGEFEWREIEIEEE